MQHGIKGTPELAQGKGKGAKRLASVVACNLKIWFNFRLLLPLIAVVY